MHLRNAAVAVLVLAAGVCSQDDKELIGRVLAALRDEPAVGQRTGILQPADDEPAGRPPMCPICRTELQEVPLGETVGIRFEGPLVYSAEVCVEDALFFVRVRGDMTSGDAGPFALPAPGEKPVRRALPWGMTLMPNEPVAVPDGWAPNAHRSMDGSLVVGGGPRPGLQVWDGKRMLFEERGPMGLTAMALSDDGSRIALARSMGSLRMVSLRTGKPMGTIAVRRANVTHVAFDPTGTRVAFAVMQGGSGPYEIRVGKATGGKSRELLRVDLDPRHLVWLLAAKRLIVSSYRGVVQSVPLGGGAMQWQTELEFPPEQLVASPDGSRLLATGAGGRKAALLDSLAGTVIRKIRIDPLYSGDSSLGCAAAWRADGHRVAWTLADGRLALSPTGPANDLRLSLGGADLTMPGPMRLRFSANGNELVTVRLDGEQMSWDVAKFVARR